MSEKIINARQQQKHDLEVNWLKAINFIPKAGEIIIYDAENEESELPKDRSIPINSSRIKIGDGVTNINILPFTIQEPDIIIMNVKWDDEKEYLVADYTYAQIQQFLQNNKTVIILYDNKTFMLDIYEEGHLSFINYSTTIFPEDNREFDVINVSSLDIWDGEDIWYYYTDYCYLPSLDYVYFTIENAFNTAGYSDIFIVTGEHWTEEPAIGISCDELYLLATEESRKIYYEYQGGLYPCIKITEDEAIFEIFNYNNDVLTHKYFIMNDNWADCVFTDELPVNQQGGANGESAYEIAVRNGFEGTEKEWLASLKGETGNSGVYVGSGDMPEDCNVQIDPTGEAFNLDSELAEKVPTIVSEDIQNYGATYDAFASVINNEVMDEEGDIAGALWQSASNVYWANFYSDMEMYGFLSNDEENGYLPNVYTKAEVEQLVAEGNAVVVTYDSNKVTSMTSQEIYAEVQKGKLVLLRVGDDYVSCAAANESEARFENSTISSDAVAADGEKYNVQLFKLYRVLGNKYSSSHFRIPVQAYIDAQFNYLKSYVDETILGGAW